METHEDEDKLLRSVALQNANSIRLARQRAEQELLRAKEALELKTAELAQSLSMMRATLESTTDGILVTNDRGNVTGFNERYVEMWRMPRAVMDSREHRRLLDAICHLFLDPQRFLARIDAIYTAAPPESFDVLELRDGRVFERFSRTQIVEKCHVGRVWSFRDVTERRRAEDALRESGERLRFMAESMPQKIFTAKANGDLDYLNQQWTDFTGVASARIREFAWVEFIHPDDVAETLYRWQHSIDTGAPFEIEHRFRRNDGVYRWHLSRAHAMRDAESRIVMWTGSNTDIDDIKQAAEERTQLLDSERHARTEAEKASAMKDEFLATLSHELRTPLSAILGWSQILRLRSATPAELKQGLETIERNARVQTQLIEDLLDMSRIASGKVRLDIQPIEPMSFIEAAIETVRPAADAKRIKLEKLLDPAAGPVAGDPGRLQQVVWNLLSNAIKFTPGGGKVQVVLERVSSHIEISVADTGIGIKPQFVPHVFERFRQADASTTRTFGGLGLGLSIVRHLVELHGGTVRVRSAGEGSGATFCVHLPLTAVHSRIFGGDRLQPNTPSANLMEFKRSDLSEIKVLVVDDEADARELIKRVLSECDAEVLTAGTAIEALAIIERELPHVLVSDIGMPDVDGYELLKRVRALGRAKGGRVPAIALTAFARSEDRTRALRAGFLVHVSKPIEPSELIATVASVAGRTGEPAIE